VAIGGDGLISSTKQAELLVFRFRFQRAFKEKCPLSSRENIDGHYILLLCFRKCQKERGQNPDRNRLRP